MQHGAAIINLSTGGTEPNVVERAAIRFAVESKVLVVAAAGNDGQQIGRYPAAYDNVVGVGSIGADLTPSSFSNTGDHVDLVAPGDEILSLGLSGYRTDRGTSMAAAYVSGSAALALSHNRELDGERLGALLSSSALAPVTSNLPRRRSDMV